MSSCILLKKGFYYFDENKKIYNKGLLSWDGTNIGSIKDYATLVPRKIQDKIIFIKYNDSYGDYAILEPYTENIMILFKLMKVWHINIRPYHICQYKNKLYFMYHLEPYEDKFIGLTEFRLRDKNDYENNIVLFLWICGVKCKFLIKDNMIYPVNFTEVNYSKNRIQRSYIKNYFKKFDDLMKFSYLYNDINNLNRVEMILTDNYGWYNKILEMIRNLF